MKIRKPLLCLFAFVCMTMNVMSQSNREKINLESITTSSTSNKGTRSVFLKPSAFFYSDSQSILITFPNGFADVQVSVTNLSTAETIFSDSYSTSEIVLDLVGLLNEGEEYRLEITIGDIVLYGDFIY